MPFALDYLLAHVYAILFLWTLIEQLGIPLPSAPILLAVGSLTLTHHLPFLLILLCAVSGSFLGDTVLFWLGRRFGGVLMRQLCRLTGNATVCVRRTEGYFTRYGVISLLMAKFVPGLATVAAPIAGESKMRFRRFMFWDLCGILIWTISVLLGGRFFIDLLKSHPYMLSHVEHYGLLLLGLLFVGLVSWRYIRQRLMVAEMRMARIFPDELKARIDSGDELIIIDLRHRLDVSLDDRTLPGALRLSPDRLMEQASGIPRDREVVLVCTCPSEATAARTALHLRKAGIPHVRPLYGGFDGWKERGYPLERFGAEKAPEMVSV